MSIQFNCRGCGKLLKAPNEFAGKRVRCTGCQAVLDVPRAKVMAPPAPVHSSPSQAKPDDRPADEAPVVFHAKHDDEEEGIDMTAMVDVTFFLLIFFMVTSMHSLQASLPMPSPDRKQENAGARTMAQISDDADYIVVRVDADDSIWVDDVRAPSEQSLLSRLRAALRRDAAPSKMLVVAHGDSRHEAVVMALDAGATVGISDVRLASSDDEEL